MIPVRWLMWIALILGAAMLLAGIGTRDGRFFWIGFSCLAMGGIAYLRCSR
jgi:membrane protein implicated in regulation of membrane protease activity